MRKPSPNQMKRAVAFQFQSSQHGKGIWKVVTQNGRLRKVSKNLATPKSIDLIMSLPLKKDWSTFPVVYKDILKAFLGPKFDLAKHESMTEDTWIVLYNACKKLYEENDSPILILHEL